MAMIFRHKQLFPDRRESVRYEITGIVLLPFQETIKHMKTIRIPKDRSYEFWRAF
jgi:hypothetical protein